LIASIANIGFLKKNYSKAIIFYNEALSICPGENESFRNYLMGNMGLA
jgi:hypothetical protein